MPPLPIVDWEKIRAKAPQVENTKQYKDEPFNYKTYSNDWRPSADLESLKSNLMIKIPITHDILEDSAKNFLPEKDQFPSDLLDN